MIVLLCFAATQFGDEVLSEILEYCSLSFMIGGLCIGFVGLMVPAMIPLANGLLMPENEVNGHSAITIQRYFRGHLGKRMLVRRRVYVAWEKAGKMRKALKMLFGVMLVMYIAFMLYILLLYGTMFTNETGAEWFFSSMMGLFIGALIQDPFTSFMSCMWAAWRMRKFEPAVLTTKFAQGLVNIQDDRIAAQHKTGEIRAKQNARPVVGRR